MLYLIFIFIVVAVALIVMGLRSMPQISGVKPTFIQEIPRDKGPKISFLAGIFPFTSILMSKLNLEVKVKQKLAAAHLRISPSEFINFKLLFMAAMLISTPFILGKAEPMKFFITFIAGYMLPEIWLNKKIAKRKYSIARVIPETIDLLSLCVDAGLDFVASIEWLIKKGVSTNPMIEELVFVMEEIQWGKPRSQALKDMAKRLNLPEVNSFIQTLVLAERMGTPVTEAFARLSEDARLQRFYLGERFAMKAPIKILLPLIFCILPVIGIIIGGPIFLQFTQGKMFQGF